VVFESFTDTTSQTDDWVGIVFTSTSTNSSLDHVVIRNAQVGVETHVPITITNSRFEDCEIGVEAWDDVTIRGSTITDVEDYGVWIREGSGTLVADSILSSGAYGVAAYPDTSTDVTSVSLRDCVVSDNDGYGVWSWGATTSSTLRQCDIYDNDVAGLTFAANHTADVESCLVHNNNIGLSQAVGTAAIDFKFVTFEGNTTGVNAYSSNAVSLEADTLRDNTVGLYCYSASPSVKNGNYVRGNDEGIKCDQYSNAVVESTTVWFNDVGVVSLNGSNPDLGHESGGSSEGYNSFVSSTTYHVENRDTNVTVMAEENWWKYATGPDTSKVHGPVDFIPWLGTAPSLVPESRPGPEVVDLTRYPLRYELSYNYPNPFNPVTSVRYEVPPPGGPVTVSIFNVQGKLIRTLVEGTRRPGVYRLQWDGIDRTGAQVASGVYFLRMQAVGYQSVKKIVLIK
jgi:flagellar hook assembly protein FlgD